MLNLIKKKVIFLASLILFVVIFSNGCNYFKQQEFNSLTRVQTFAGQNNEIGEPFGVATMGNDVYISDGQNNKIIKISQDGKQEVITNKLDTPSQIVFDSRGNLLVADSGSHTVKRVLQSGEVEIVAGVENKKGFQDGVTKGALFNAPIGIAVDESKIYVADTYNDKIRVIENGKVSTLAGGEQGFADGSDAKFNTPTSLAVWKEGKILVADSENRRIRVIEKDGRTWTLTGNGNQNLTNGLLNEAEFVQPSAIAVGKDGSIFIADGNSIRVIGRRLIPIVETLSDERRGFLDGKALVSRFNRPSGLALDKKGNLFVTDSENLLVRAFSEFEVGKKLKTEDFDKAQKSAEEFRKVSEPRWTYDPPKNTREIAGTLGEIRGKLKDEDSVAWFHNGLDIVGGYGETAHFIRDEKVLRPIAVQNYDTTRELIRMPTIGYIHIRLGRDVKQVPFEDERFQFSVDADGKPNGVRVPRGAKFKAGEIIGTLNTFNHVHLIAGRTGREMNALDALVLPGASDSRVPTIESVSLYDENWGEIETQKSSERIELSGKIRIVVRAYDQMDGNAARRKLGLFKVGYQVFDDNEKPLEEFREPLWNIKFDKTPSNEAVKLVYALGSQSGATGETIFNYIATNQVSGRLMKENFFDVSKLKSGNYILRVLVADFFGNIASEDIKFKKN